MRIALHHICAESLRDAARAPTCAVRGTACLEAPCLQAPEARRATLLPRAAAISVLPSQGTG